MSIGHPSAVNSGDDSPININYPPTITPRQELRRLLLRCSRGDVQAFAHFYDWTYPVVLDYQFLRTGQIRLTEDLVAGTYLKAMTSVCDYPSSGMSGESWILRIARSLARGQDGPFGIAVDSYRDLSAGLIQAMKQVGLLGQECLALRYFFCYDERMIGDIVGLPLTDVHTSLRAGRRALTRLAPPS